MILSRRSGLQIALWPVDGLAEWIARARIDIRRLSRTANRDKTERLKARSARVNETPAPSVDERVKNTSILCGRIATVSLRVSR